MEIIRHMFHFSVEFIERRKEIIRNNSLFRRKLVFNLCINMFLRNHWFKSKLFYLFSVKLFFYCSYYVKVVKSKPKLGFVDTFGYVSLFPMLLMQLQPDSPRLTQLLQDLPQVCWIKALYFNLVFFSFLLTWTRLLLLTLINKKVTINC